MWFFLCVCEPHVPVYSAIYVLRLQHCTVYVYVICVCQMFCILKPVAMQMWPRERARESEREGHMDKVTWAHHVLLLEAW